MVYSQVASETKSKTTVSVKSLVKFVKESMKNQQTDEVDEAPVVHPQVESVVSSEVRQSEDIASYAPAKVESRWFANRISEAAKQPGTRVMETEEQERLRELIQRKNRRIKMLLIALGFIWGSLVALLVLYVVL